MSHVAYERVMSHVKESYLVCNESRHMRTSHVTRERVMPHMQ